MKKLKFTGLCAALALAGPVIAQDAETDVEPSPEVQEIAALETETVAGEEHYDGNCKSCHGPSANGMASFPKLTGHDAEYLIMRLTQYRAGETVGYNTALMAPNAVDLTDQEIADLAAYIVSLD